MILHYTLNITCTDYYHKIYIVGIERCYCGVVLRAFNDRMQCTTCSRWTANGRDLVLG